MGEKLDQLNQDYLAMDRTISQRIKLTTSVVEALQLQVKNLEENYLKIKERILNGEDEEEIFKNVK
jgi:hypothetical protein